MFTPTNHLKRPAGMTAIAVAGTLLLGPTGAVHAGSDTHTSHSDRTGDRSSDTRAANEKQPSMSQDFVWWAADGHRLAIQSAELVLDKDVDLETRGLAERLRADHQAGMALLEEAAEKAGIMVPTGFKYDLTEDKFSKMQEITNSDELSAVFVFSSVGAAAESQMWFEHGSVALPEPPLRDYATKLGPILDGHLQASREASYALIADAGRTERSARIDD